MKLPKKTKGFPKTTPFIQQEKTNSHNEIPTEAETEDYDYTFSLYEEEEKEEHIIESIKDIEKHTPKITNYKSKYGNSLQEIESLQYIKNEITKYAIKVSSHTDEGNDLWMLYGCLDEYWSKIKIIFGSVIQNDILKMQLECKEMLIKYTSKGTPNYDLNEKLLNLRNKIYMLSQRAGLGIEIEKIHSFRSEVRNRIIQ